MTPRPGRHDHLRRHRSGYRPVTINPADTGFNANGDAIVVPIGPMPYFPRGLSKPIEQYRGQRRLRIRAQWGLPQMALCFSM
jgi:hypothetical protein